MQTLELCVALALLAAGNVDHQPSTPMLEPGVAISPSIKSHGQTPGATVEPGGPRLALGSIFEPNGYGSLIEPNGVGSLIEPNGYGMLIEPGGLSLALGSIFEPNGFGSLIEPNGWSLIEPDGISLALGSLVEPNGFGSLIEPSGFSPALGLANEVAHIS